MKKHHELLIKTVLINSIIQIVNINEYFYETFYILISTLFNKTTHFRLKIITYISKLNVTFLINKDLMKFRRIYQNSFICIAMS